LTVEAGKTLSYVLPSTNSYDFSVHGPNGVFRRFAGTGDNKLNVAFRFDSTPAKLRGTFDNTGWEPLSLQFPNGYQAGSSEPLVVEPGKPLFVDADFAKTANWYDVTVEGPGGFVRQFAGHVENGAPSLSDPLLG